MKYIVTAFGQILDFLIMPTDAAALAQLAHSTGDAVHGLPANAPRIDGSVLEVVSGVLTRKAGVVGDVPGEGLEVTTIE